MKSYVPFLSLRYLWFHKVSSGLGILGVTLGVGLVIVVVGVMDGFQARLKGSLVSNATPVVVRPFFDLDAEKFADALKAQVPGVLEASPVVASWTFVAPKSRRAQEGIIPCQVWGIDAAREIRVADLERKLRRGRTAQSPYSLLPPATPELPFLLPEDRRGVARAIRREKQGVVLGRRLMVDLGVGPGSEIQVFTVKREPDPGGAGPGNGGPKSGIASSQELFIVTGSFDSGDYEFNQVLLMDRRDLLSFGRDVLSREATEVRLLLADPEDCDGVKAAIEERSEALVAASLRKGGQVGVRPVEAQTWKDIHRRILSAVENERILLIVITGFSFIVVAFLIGSTQSMLVVEKTREIGVLRSLGASVAGTSAVFVGNGFVIGTVGALAGWGLGGAVTSNIQAIVDFLDRLGIVVFPPDIYRFDEVPIEVKGGTVAVICGGAVAFALLGSLLPAVRASMLDPVESLHHE